VENDFDSFRKADIEFVFVLPTLDMFKFGQEWHRTCRRAEYCQVVGVFPVNIFSTQWYKVGNHIAINDVGPMTEP